MIRHLFVAAALTADATAGAATPADLVLTHAKIVTEDDARPSAEALAVRGGKLVYVGDAAGARAYVGTKTRVEDAGGHLVLPGLVDAHIHPTAIAELPACTLDSRPISLTDLAPFVQECIARFGIRPGEWVAVQQWNPTAGNEPSAGVPTFRAALDRASKDRPIVLIGNDGHHGAFNSLALSRARTSKGEVVGYSRATLRAQFAPFAKLVGVDASGEPNGTVNEDARDVMGPPNILSVNFPQLMKAPGTVPARLASVGITALQDAVVTPDTLAYYDLIRKRGLMTFRANLMLYFTPEEFARRDGTIDYAKVLAEAGHARARYAHDDLVRADTIKIFADGVLEGNPYATPPTLPESPSLKPYLQPIFGPGEDGKLRVTGYVDTASPLCAAVREHPADYEAPAAVSAFMTAHGYHPAQCAISSGKLQHDRQVILDYAKAAHLAGFTLHIHAIGDAAVRTAVDAIENARAADGNDRLPDTLAHLQVVAPEDIARIGRDHLYLAFTYSWANADPTYDLAVTPFFERVTGTGHAAFHDPSFYYERQFYPTHQALAAGGILAAGSDAPVNTRDPQPFVNMQIGVTRALPGLPPANPAERLTIEDLVAAYTIHGAQAMGRAAEFGSLAPGKSADFIELDQDIFALAHDGHPEKIGATKVLRTWFRGKAVYSTP